MCDDEIKSIFLKRNHAGKVVDMYRALGIDLPGKVAVKVHTGEKGNQNFLRPEFWRPMVEAVNGTIVECNTAYGDAAGGVRDHTESHMKLLEEHQWTKYFDVDLMDAEDPDLVWPIMIPCWCWRILKAIPWAGTAEPLNSLPSAVLHGQEKR